MALIDEAASWLDSSFFPRPEKLRAFLLFLVLAH